MRTCLARTAALVILLLMEPVCPAGPTASAAGEDEDEVKAAFLINFPKFVDWPSPDALLEICILGEERLVSALLRGVAGKGIAGRVVHVRGLVPNEAIDRCNVLFLPDHEPELTARTVARAFGRPILTIGETDVFLRSGGIIRLYRDGDRMRFQVNAAAAGKAGLRISSQLLSLAAS